MFAVCMVTLTLQHLSSSTLGAYIFYCTLWCMLFLSHTWCLFVLSHIQRCWSTLGSPMHKYHRTIFRWPKANWVCIEIFWCNDLKGTETNVLCNTAFNVCVCVSNCKVYFLKFWFFRICDLKGEKDYFCCSWLICLFLQLFVTCWW